MFNRIAHELKIVVSISRVCAYFQMKKLNSVAFAFAVLCGPHSNGEIEAQSEVWHVWFWLLFSSLILQIFSQYKCCSNLEYMERMITFSLLQSGVSIL